MPHTIPATDIPVDAAKDIAQRYGYDQVMIIARKVGPDGREHVTTYGDGKEHCAVAAHVGQFVRSQIMGWPCQPHERAASMLLRERERQISVEGWTPEHDDIHTDGEMARAAAEYAKVGASRWEADSARRDKSEGVLPPINWPWHADWWKPRDRISNLVRAGALIIAELERIQRDRRPLQREIEKAER